MVRRSSRLQAAAGAVNDVEQQEHNNNNNDDDEEEDFLEMNDECPCCRRLSTCEPNKCKYVASELANNATATATSNDYSDMDSYERISAISEQLLANPSQHRLQQFDLSGVCENLTTETTNPPSQHDDDPPQDNDQQGHYRYLNFPGIEEFIADIAGTEGWTEELETMQRQLDSGIRIDTSVLESDEEQAKYVITAALCVYNHSFRRLSEDECKKVMDDVLQLIQPHISLEIPDELVETLYRVFANPGRTLSDDAGVFTDKLGASFGRAYQNMTGQNDGGDDDDDDDDEEEEEDEEKEEDDEEEEKDEEEEEEQEEDKDDYHLDEEESEVSWSEEEESDDDDDYDDWENDEE
jgi:hypothetical protein